MTIQNISVEAAIERVKTIAEEKNLSPALKSSLEVLLLLVALIVNQLGLNSKNSSKPPSDPNLAEEAKRGERAPKAEDNRVVRRPTLNRFPIRMKSKSCR